MFLEDIRLYVLPYGSGSGDGFAFEVDADTEEAPLLIHRAIPTHGYRNSRAADSLREFMESALHFLALGKMYLEIEYFRSTDDENASTIAFKFEFLDPELVTRRFGRYYYRQATEPTTDNTVRWSQERLEPKSLIVVSLPRKLRRQLDRSLRIFRVAGADLQVMSRFVRGAHGASSGFDLATYQRKSHDIVLRESRATGWTGRGMYAEGLLDPAKAWRAIQFARLVVRLREQAMAGLQSAVNTAGAEMGFAASLTLSKVLTLHDLDRMERDLEAGVRPISEMLDPRVS